AAQGASVLLVVMAGGGAVAPRPGGPPAAAGAGPPPPPLAPPARASAARPAGGAPRRAAAPRVVGACGPAQREKGVARFVLAHFNDLQARYSDTIAGKSRYAYIAGYLKQLKASQPTIVLDAGDDYEKGAVAELRSLGETTRQMVQALPIDV